MIFYMKHIDILAVLTLLLIISGEIARLFKRL